MLRRLCLAVYIPLYECFFFANNKTVCSRFLTSKLLLLRNKDDIQYGDIASGIFKSAHHVMH